MTTPALRALDAAYSLARPLLFRLEPERAHQLALATLRHADRLPPSALLLVRHLLGTVGHPAEAVEAFGLRFPNAVGLAAGLDKNAIALKGWAALGFGHVEVGTVTPVAQPGNPRPRVFRLKPDRALINRMGFPNEGAEAVAGRLAKRGCLPLVVGGNVGKNAATPLERAADDYTRAALHLAPWVDYLVVNVSSPNTLGLRSLQTPEHVRTVVRAVTALGPKPVLLKLAPDLAHEDLPEIVAAAAEAGAVGLIAANTTLRREGLRSPPNLANEAGGVSGAPLKALVLRLTERLAELGGSRLPVISVGGIESPTDVRDRLAAGAVLVQVYSALIYAGPALPARLVGAPWPSDQLSVVSF